MIKHLILTLAAFTLGHGPFLRAADEPRPEFRQRVHGFFEVESGQPLKRAAKKFPLRKGSGNYTRAYSNSICLFAARCFYLDEMLEEANAALVENAQHYLDNYKDIVDRDSFHWHADIVMRLIDMYGPNGSAHPGRLTAETEAICLKPIWTYVQTSAKHKRPDHVETRTWAFHSTENHHSMDVSVRWHFAKLAKDKPEYKDKKLECGSTLAELYRGWNEYIRVYFLERARKGVAIEIMCMGYNMVWLKGFYNFRDFGEPDVKESVDKFLDLYWAYWAQEQLNGVEGGGMTRIRGVKGFKPAGHGITSMAWFYFGVGAEPTTISGGINALLSDYEPATLVADIVRTSRDNGPYEIRQRAQGLGKTGISSAMPRPDMTPNRFRTDGGGIVRYSYCDPAFTIGTLMTEARPNEDWVAISAQSRWQGVVFGDNPNARIVPVVLPAGKARDVLNPHWSVQHKGSLITQKLKGNSKGGQMVVWMPEEGMAEPVRDGDLVFVETEGAYAVIRVAGSDFELTDKLLTRGSIEGSVRQAPSGRVVIPKDDFAPVILEVISKTEVQSFTAFKEKVKASEPSMKGSVLSYRTIYGDTVTFDAEQKKVPTINGKPVDYSPPKVLESPFLNSVYNSGVVTIRNGDRTKILDFN